ncbi:MAG: outer membrane protein assembly factor BamA [Lentisphaeria bacterium]|nr:outer membrane protein assembly factor BamA [Lentisphaeria bacterium]
MKRFLCLIPAVFILSAAYLSAQEIHSVEFRQDGTYRFGKDILNFNVQSRKGNPYDEQVVNEDIKRLYNTGFFSDIRAEMKRRPDGNVDLIFHVVPKDIVRSVKFQGNEKFEAHKLYEYVTLTIGAPLNDKRLSETIAALRDFYSKEGLNDVTITYSPTRNIEGGIDIVFKIKENLKVTIKSVSFEGLKAFEASELEERLANRKSMFSWVPFLNLGLLNKRELDNDMVRLRDAYWSKGYLDFKVKEVRMNTVEGKPEQVDLVFVIEEGEVYTVGNVSVRGATRFSNEELLKKVRLVSGQPFSSDLERVSAERLEEDYSPLGYVEFQAKPIRVPDFRTHKVDVVFEVQEGLPYKVREVFISGNRWTKDHVIRRELAIAPGDAVDKQRIKASRSRLMGMGYFHKVDAVSVNSPVAGTKDIDIKVDEKNFLHARIGGGYSDTDGLAGMIELTHTNMDILDPKNYFTGGGQRARLLALVGTENMDFEADFTEPWLFGIPLRWEVSGYMRNVIYDDWEEQRIGFTTSLTKRIFDDFTSVSAGYTFEHVRVHRMDKWLSPELRSQRGSDFVGKIYVTLDRDTRDSAIDPTSGYNVNLLTAFASRALGGSHDYLRLELKGSNYYSFFDKMLILSLGAKVGMIGMLDDWDGDVPLYERYFLGGGDTIRGFPYRSIGPVDSYGDNMGGNFMYLFTAEISHPIWRFIRGAAFVDVGGATDFRQNPFSHVNIGVGYGLRIKLPAVNAPIKLDLAYPVLNNQPGVSSRLRFHFNMGFALF